jgi:hypothetical protein
VKLTVKFAWRLLPLLSLPFFGSGCTYALWTNGNLDAYKEPALSPNLRLYESKQKNDILVVYKEYAERNESTNTRAYWLNKNEKRVENQYAPGFVRKGSASHLTPIPVFYSVPEKADFTRGSYAVCETNQQSFKLFSNGREICSFSLPVYKDRRGSIEKIALTPFAVSADVTVVGACAGVYYLYLRDTAQ